MIGQKRIPAVIPEVAEASKPLRGSPSVHLDALRGLAAFSVLLFHWRENIFFEYHEFAHHNPLIAAMYLVSAFGQQWVIVFFVMSGFLVGGSVLRSVDSGRWSWRGYLFARLTRLYLVLLPAFLLGGILDFVGIQLTGSQAYYAGLTRDGCIHADLTFPTLVANCLFLQNIKLPGSHWFPVYGTNGPLWSLSNEFWYYIAFPLLVLMLAKGRSWWVRFACGLGLVAWAWFVGSDVALLGIPWLMGALIAFLPPFPARGPWIRRIALGAALALFAASFPVAVKAHLFGWKILKSDWIVSSLFGLVVTYLIWVTLHCATAPLPSVYVKTSQRLARSSYTLYLTHFPLLIFLLAFLHLPRSVPSWYPFIVRVGLLTIIVIYSQLVYELFEKRTTWVRNWLKPYVMRRKTA
jgi:peptidoglycan/LPS O-acetylase OafA/YrhL